MNKSEYQISLRSLPREGTGSLRVTDLDWQVPADWTNGAETVRALREVEVELQALPEGVLARVDGRAEIASECVRCLKNLDYDLDFSLQEMFFEAGARQAAVAQGDPEGEDLLEICEDMVDLEPVMRDYLVLELESLPLCDAACRGLCPTCGEEWENLPADHAHEVLDPRWAALAGLKLEGQADSEAGDTQGGSDEREGE